MRIKKMLSLFLAIAMLITTLSVTAFAATPFSHDTSTGVITPRWVNFDYVNPDISSSGTTIYYDALITATSPSASITGTIYLEKYSAGKWTSVASGSIRGTGSVNVEKSYTGVKGTEYRTKVVVTVAGEKATAYSDSCTV